MTLTERIAGTRIASVGGRRLAGVVMFVLAAQFMSVIMAPAGAVMALALLRK